MDLDRESEGGNLILKFDMSKAYDRLEWRFLLCALRAMGFSTQFQDIVYRSICNIWYKVNVNGFLSSNFKLSRGVRQGDLLSPLLFIVAQQVLSYNLSRLETKGAIRPYNLGRNVASISHLFYADDMLVFSNGHARSIAKLKQMLSEYEKSSGQKINFEKIGFYPSKLIPHNRIHRIERTLGCTARKLPLLYLGAPIFKERCKAEYLDSLFQKLEGWKTRFISFAGKITLINSILASIPVHTMSCMVIPKYLIVRIERLLRTFLWNQCGQSHVQWVSWNKVARPLQEGGLGIRKFSDTIIGLRGKLAWRIIEGKSLWSRILQRKYGVLHGGLQPRNASSRLWKALFPHFQHLQQMARWQIGRGDVKIWTDNWSGEVLDPASNSRLTVREALLDLNMVRSDLSEAQVQEVETIVLEEDRLLFTPSPNGKFKIKDYLKHRRSPGPKIPWTEIIWNSFTPKRVNAFMWRLF